jgi:uncharacterized protein
MSKSKIILFVSVFLVSVLGGVLIFKGKTALLQSDVPEVDWKLLGELDYLTGKGPAKLTDFDGQRVRIPGFMVPLEDNQKNVTEFLLVPSPQACIHVPPPPPNQMVLIEMPESANAEVAYGPIWVYGKLRLHSKRHMYGESSFQMEGEKIEPYR